MVTATKTRPASFQALKSDESRTYSLKSESRPRFRALVIGNKGTGKTSLIKTCRKPVVMDVFDPQGEQVLLENGQLPSWLVVNDFSRGDPEDYVAWVNQFMELRATPGFFESVGTYVLDSTTTWSEALIAWIIKDAKARVTGHGDTLTQPDWGTLLDKVRQHMKMCLALPCDVLILGHLQKDVDQVTGRIGYEVMVSGSSSQKLPIYFSEVYVLDVERDTQKGTTRRYLVTANDGLYKCSSRLSRELGAGKNLFELHEPASIKHLMEKAGISTEDLPYE